MKKSFILKNVEALYDLLKRSKLSVFLFPRQVRGDLEALNQDTKNYYVQKLMRSMCVLLILLFILICGLKSIYVARNSTINAIKRPKSYGEQEEVSLRVDGIDTYTLDISPHMLTETEAKQAFDDFVTEITDYILGNNQDAMEITENLTLPDKVEGYPFNIYWESEKEHIIDCVGNVYREQLEQDELVKLTAVCTYMEYQWETEFCVQVQKEILSEEEAYKRSLGTYLLEDEKNNRLSEVWNLPEYFQGVKIQYQKVEKWDKLIILAGLVCITGIALWIGSDKDLHNERKKRQALYEEAYLNFVSSLALYISAGLNLQMAMKYCVNDYTRKKSAGHILRELLSDFEKDISNGYSFQAALDLFANKADHIYYKRLSGLLQQGLLNGTNDLARSLEQEVEKIREDKRRQCKVKGEKMSSALIAPMLLQLCIVIAFIMLPAFSNMQFS